MAKKTRASIPRVVSEKVLKEYRHKCAICGRPEPHLHHLDENPDNNDPLNLLPLCPNCHLQDAHDPTSPPDPRKLRLFRKFKDPLVLDPRFHPIFCRTIFLRDLKLRKEHNAHFTFKANELLDFISELEMGKFYRKKLLSFFNHPYVHYANKLYDEGSVVTDETIKKDELLRDAAYIHCANLVDSLLIEQLRYQQWISP